MLMEEISSYVTFCRNLHTLLRNFCGLQSLMIEVKSISNSQILNIFGGFEQQSTEENRESAKPNYAIDNDAPC